MRIWTLTENTACREGIRAEHGLSLYIETGGHRILFDMGQSDAFAENAVRMGIDLAKVDLAVLSHGHYDHGGGLKRFLEINSRAKIYMSRNAFGEHYNASGNYIGLDRTLAGCERLIFVEDILPLGTGMMLYSCNERSRLYPTDAAGLQILRDGQPEADDFLHELYLLVEEAGKRICISGCSHKGILNIAAWLPCDVLVGGFHFMKLDPDGEQVKRAAEILADTDTVFYTCHCTGQAQFAAMKEKMGNRLHYLAAGAVLDLWENLL